MITQVAKNTCLWASVPSDGYSGGQARIGRPVRRWFEFSGTHFSLRSSGLFATAVLLAATVTAIAEPLFKNSVVSNNLDFIREDDPEESFCLQYLGTTTAEVPDKRSDVLFVDDVRMFRATFADDEIVQIFVHPDVGTSEQATVLVDPVIRAVARLPTQMRARLSHIVIHQGSDAAFSEDVGRFFVMYSENIKSRVSTRDISETVFHESVHATLDVPHASSAAWLTAQKADARFITEYAAGKPSQEDMAESALFAWAIIKHPGRLPPEIEAKTKALMPHRLAYFKTLFSDWDLPAAQQVASSC